MGTDLLSDAFRVLQVVQIPVASRDPDQLIMASALDNAPALQNNNPLGVANSGETVRHHNLRALIPCNQLRHLTLSGGI